MHDHTSTLKFQRWFPIPICLTINQVQIYHSIEKYDEQHQKRQELSHAALHQKGRGVRWKSKFYFLYVCNTNHFSICCISLNIWEPALEQQQPSHTAPPKKGNGTSLRSSDDFLHVCTVNSASQSVLVLRNMMTSITTVRILPCSTASGRLWCLNVLLPICL